MEGGLWAPWLRIDSSLPSPFLMDPQTRCQPHLGWRGSPGRPLPRCLLGGASQQLLGTSRQQVSHLAAQREHLILGPHKVGAARVRGTAPLCSSSLAVEGSSWLLLVPPTPYSYKTRGRKVQGWGAMTAGSWTAFCGPGLKLTSGEGGVRWPRGRGGPGAGAECWAQAHCPHGDVPGVPARF